MERLMVNEEMVKAMKEVKKGNVKVRNELITKNLPLIYKIANAAGINGVPIEDVIQDGVEFFIKQINAYDPSKGSLSTFLWRPVMQAMYRANIEMPERLAKYTSNLKRKIEALSTELGRDPTEDEICNEMGITKKEYRSKAENIKFFSPTSIDTPVESEDSGSECSFSDFIKSEAVSPAEDFFNALEIEDLMKGIENQLTPKEKLVLNYRYNINGCCGDSSLSLRETGEKIGLNYETVRLIEKSGLKKLRLYMENLGYAA